MEAVLSSVIRHLSSVNCQLSSVVRHLFFAPILRQLKTFANTLTAAELQLVADAGFIYTKNGIIDKVIAMFGRLAEEYQSATGSLSAEWPQVFGPHPKISKGEKQAGLPWVILDYPRLFDKQVGHLAIRTFFWWGKFFSIQLQVSGSFMRAFLKELPEWLKEDSSWFTGVTADAWDMALPNAHWIALDHYFSPEGFHLAEGQVLKLAKKIPIEQWESVEAMLPQYFEKLIQLAAASLSHLGGEKAP